MEIPSELNTAVCVHCEKDIPKSNIELHSAHCHRNLQKCAICGDTVPKKQAEEHYNDIHAPVDCSLCSETVPREVWATHKGEQCAQRIVTCEYCDFPMPAADLFKHQEVCGNRTEFCHRCNKYIKLREQINHEIQFHDSSNGAAESSRGSRTFERIDEDDDMRPRPADADADAAPPQRKILFTIAVTGIAVLLGSFFLQTRVDPQQQALDADLGPIVRKEATPKTLMRAMGVEGLTLYHLKSHLQKYRMGRQSCKELPDNPTDASGAVESRATGSTSSSSSRRITNNLNDGCNGAMRIQMEPQRRPQEHMEVQVQQRLEIRITAQEKYLHSILERACSVLIQPDLTAMEMFVSVRHDLPQFPAWGAEGYEHRSEVITPPFLEGKSANRVVPPHRVKAEEG